MEKPKIILFDWDNTLAITRLAVVKSMNYVLSKYDLEEWDTAKNKYRDKTKSLKDNFSNFFGDNSSTAYQEYIAYYIEQAIGSVEAEKNAVILLKKIKDSNIKIVVLSNKDHTLLDKEVVSAFPDIEFDGVFGNNDFAENKPSAIPVINICEQFGIERNPVNVWLVGDSSQDTNCAINANIQGVLVGKGNLMNEKDKQKLKQHNILKVSCLADITQGFSL
jgi:phosphoglycolate phosphatase